ncbi:hypothetical protein, partial [Bifidobacterium catenulatum]
GPPVAGRFAAENRKRRSNQVKGKSMESFLSMLAGWFMGLWTWLVELNGMLQVVLVLLCVVASGVCAIIGKRMGSPMIVESGGQTWSRTLVTAIAWIAGVILMLIAVLAIAAVFAPLLGFAA